METLTRCEVIALEDGLLLKWEEERQVNCEPITGPCLKIIYETAEIQTFQYSTQPSSPGGKSFLPSIKVDGIIGLVEMKGGWYLLAVTRSQLVGHIEGKPQYRVQRIIHIPLAYEKARIMLINLKTVLASHEFCIKDAQ